MGCVELIKHSHATPILQVVVTSIQPYKMLYVSFKYLEISNGFDRRQSEASKTI
jgi:hypothetical protein